MAAKPSVGIVGFGDFGQFLAARMVKAGFRVLATSRSPYHSEAAALGVEFHQSADAFCEAAPDVVLLATSILSTDKVLASLPLHKLSSSTLFVDVLSVKAYPKALLQAVLPPQADILCTHPMFGPVSGAGSWAGLTFMYDAVRVADTPASAARLESFLDFWAAEGCRLVEMSCEEHDRQAASTQFITHTVGRVLGGMELASTDINTRGFESLLQLVANTTSDSFDLYYGLFLYNNNALQQLERMEAALAAVKKQLLDQLHEIARREIMGPAAAGAAAALAAASAQPAASNIVPFKGSSSSSSSSSNMVQPAPAAQPAAMEPSSASWISSDDVASAAISMAPASDAPAAAAASDGADVLAWECPSALASESFHKAGRFAALRSFDSYSAFVSDCVPAWMHAGAPAGSAGASRAGRALRCPVVARAVSRAAARAPAAGAAAAGSRRFVM